MESGSGRVTPYELVFEQYGIAEQEFPAIAREAQASGVKDSRREQFAHMSSVSALVQGLLPEELDPATIDAYVDILFHCYHFWRAGCPLYVVPADLARALVESPPDVRGWSVGDRSTTAYFELPRNQFWAAVTEGGPPEPVDGLFLQLEAESRVVRVLTVLGMRPDRPGFSVAALRADIERSPEVVGADAFRSDIPGADLAGIYSLQRASEAAALGLRLLWYVGTYPEALEEMRGQPGAPDGYDYESPTALDHKSLRLVERDRG